MNAFDKLKQSCRGKQLVRLDDLPIGEYVVQKFSIIQTRYGEKIRVDLDDKWIILPSRFESFTAEDIENLNKIAQLLIYKGRDPLKKNM